MNIESIIATLKEECEKHKKSYAELGLSKIDPISLTERVAQLSEIDAIVTKLLEYHYFHPEHVEKMMLSNEYLWLSNQYRTIASQLVGTNPSSKKRIYEAHGIDAEKLELIKRLWPEHKYPHGPEYPDLIFKIRSEYLDSLAVSLKNLNDEVV